MVPDILPARSQRALYFFGRQCFTSSKYSLAVNFLSSWGNIINFASSCKSAKSNESQHLISHIDSLSQHYSYRRPKTHRIRVAEFLRKIKKKERKEIKISLCLLVLLFYYALFSGLYNSSPSGLQA